MAPPFWEFRNEMVCKKFCVCIDDNDGDKVSGSGFIWYVLNLSCAWAGEFKSDVAAIPLVSAFVDLCNSCLLLNDEFGGVMTLSPLVSSKSKLLLVTFFSPVILEIPN